MEQIGRFAPSPSGRMHLGNVFSAMLAWLSIRSCGGRLVLRIEDLDPDRCRPEYADQLKRDLEWLGLTWDEEQTPQSLRSEAYRGMFSRLEEKRLVYPCYCSRGEVHAASAPHASDGTLLYAGTPSARQKRKRRAGAWQFRTKTFPLPMVCKEFIRRIWRAAVVILSSGAQTACMPISWRLRPTMRRRA